jgi:hypothetical protein
MATMKDSSRFFFMMVPVKRPENISSVGRAKIKNRIWRKSEATVLNSSTGFYKYSLNLLSLLSFWQAPDCSYQ